MIGTNIDNLIVCYSIRRDRVFRWFHADGVPRLRGNFMFDLFKNKKNEKPLIDSLLVYKGNLLKPR